jgi:hypothetical protein
VDPRIRWRTSRLVGTTPSRLGDAGGSDDGRLRRGQRGSGHPLPEWQAALTRLERRVPLCAEGVV